MLCVSSIQLYANTTASVPPVHSAEAEQKTTPPYGDNPNIFKVLAYKTGQKIHKTADQVGEATEQGIEKVKPKVEEAIDAVTGSHSAGKAPIERKSLSQSSSNNTPSTASATVMSPTTPTTSSVTTHTITEQPAEIQRIPQQNSTDTEPAKLDHEQTTPPTQQTDQQPNQQPSNDAPQADTAPASPNAVPTQKPIVHGITEQSDNAKPNNRLEVISL
ncbi:hypothetical protein BFG52_13935 [Acinetobacter larvae]|uniref:Uncharacterized protein n=2 Tax=Acinetobacter larvae TaxID=1789224 RepID=A0A1B2M2D4_9GAMM|nr:hypothetical protein BFG52_13935 [Acinetobacter larvae]